jgi:anti-sigma28 factor (negative regulator of flagellin synthesis)
MKITNEHVARLLAARLQQVQRSAPPAVGPHSRKGLSPAEQGAGQSDRAVFSSVVEDLRIGLAAARRRAGELRQGGEASGRPDTARLAALAAQVRAGRYRVPAEQIADALLSDLRGA